jgi:hypothetical protein
MNTNIKRHKITMAKGNILLLRKEEITENQAASGELEQ